MATFQPSNMFVPILQLDTPQEFQRYPELELHSAYMRNKLQEFYKKWPRAKKSTQPSFMTRMSFDSDDMEDVTFDEPH